LVLQILALACLLCAAMRWFEPATPNRPLLGWLGLFLWLLSLMLTAQLHATNG
jgi:hypothetical protein